MISRFMVALICLFSSFAYSAIFKSENTQILSQWLSGIYISTNDVIQGREISISLHTFPIWQNRLDGEWLYTESGVIDSSNKPFRQRILQLVATPNNLIRLYSYTIPRASDFAGAYNFPSILESLTPSQLTITNNCELLIRPKEKDIFVAEPDAESCLIDTGAPVMTTSFTISTVDIAFLDNNNDGYDSLGNLIPGRVDTLLAFLKLEDYDLNHHE